MHRVEIRGFKSIAKKTVLSFPGAVTCIAGPNGCGKSNVVDAIRWAIGEQSARSLRAGAMSDVIFSGTQDTPPGGMAMVTLDFVRDNGYFPASLDGFDQVSISRRLFRTGESLYTINDVRCRLKDISELFLDTGLDRLGYAIIEQGRVKDIIQSKPEDLRYVIEEVAEVGKFRVKRHEAMRRLEATSRNFERIQDLLGEVDRQRSSLRTQAGKAKRYQVLRREINDRTRELWAFELCGIRQLRDALTGELMDITRRISEAEQRRQALSEEGQKAQARLTEIRQAMEGLTQALSATRSRLELATNDLEINSKRLQDISATLEMLSSRREQARRSLSQSGAQLEEQQQAQTALEQKIVQGETELKGHEERLAALRQELATQEATYDRTRGALFDAIGQARAGDQRMDSLKKRLQEVHLNTAKRQQELDALCEEQARLKSEALNLTLELEVKQEALRDQRYCLERITREREELQVLIDGESQTHVRLEKTLAELKAKISMLERIINPPQAQARNPVPHLNGHRRITDGIMVKAGFEVTVGRSLGDVLDYVLIEDHEEVLRLPSLDGGSPGYVPRRPHTEYHGRRAPEGEGVLGPLSDFIETRHEYADVMAFLTCDMVVVDDLARAVSLWKAGARDCDLVTRDGMILERSGVLRTTMESEKYAHILKAKAEKKGLEQEERRVEAALQATREGLVQATQHMRELKGLSGTTREQVQNLERELTGLQSRQGDIQGRLERMEGRRNSFANDIQMWRDLAGKVEADLAALGAHKGELDETIATLQAEVAALEGGRAASREVLERQQVRQQEKQRDLHGLKVEHASAGERIKALHERQAAQRKEQEIDALKIEEITHTREQIESGMAQAKGHKASYAAEVERLERQTASLLPGQNTQEKLAREAQQTLEEWTARLRTLEQEKNGLHLRVREQEIASAMSQERLEARFGTELPELPQEFDPQRTRETIADLQTRVDRLGQINFASIEAYEEAQARWDDLHRQYEDLVQASERLKQVISSIERQSTREFMETFTRVRANFQEIFTTVFGGGKADIVLAEGPPMDAGVELVACPPFKRPKAMSLLSEGEKTLCAISFIFALFKVRPSPFCILDEVDAPLDEANVERFNRLIRGFARESQFIVVTHNRRTMEMADIIYGVTFDIPGISKVVSMSLAREDGESVAQQ